METAQLVLSQFKNFSPHYFRIEQGLSLPKVIVEVSVCHINRSGPGLYRDTVYITQQEALLSQRGRAMLRVCQ